MAITPTSAWGGRVFSVRSICDFLDRFAPAELAESWDNTGLLVGDPDGVVSGIMTCLTITPESSGEAIERHASLIVTHHPIPFRPLNQIVTASTTGRLLWNLIREGISIYSPHTRYDSAFSGINQQIGQQLSLVDLQPLRPIELSVPKPHGFGDAPGFGEGPSRLVGSGRMGRLVKSQPLSQFVETVKRAFNLTRLEIAGDLTREVTRVAIACGSGGSLLEPARQNGCDTFVTGETSFHTALDCRATQVSLILVGHYASERFAQEALANVLSDEFRDLDIWCSQRECDPMVWI